LRALEQLLKLVDAGAQDGLRMVFFAEAYFVQSLDKASKRTDQAQNWHEIRLTPFSADESRRYVAFRLAQAGSRDGSAFTKNELSVIVGGSSGMPGRIDELASAVLAGELTISDERRWLPRMHRALIVLVVIGAGLGWLIFSEYPKPGAGPHEEKAIAKSGPSSTPVSGTATLAIPAPPVAGATEHAEPPALQTPKQESPDPAESPVEKAVAATALPGPEYKRETPPVSARQPVAAAPPPKQAPDATQQVASPKQQSDPPPSPAVGKPRSAQWIRDQPGKYFTLQLFATSSRDKRDQFVRQQDRKEQFVTFETKRNGVPWYAVAYGSYATQAEAKSAAASLPASVGRVEPWVRTFASVQATLD
jgi:DamX protein